MTINNFLHAGALTITNCDFNWQWNIEATTISINGSKLSGYGNFFCDGDIAIENSTVQAGAIEDYGTSGVGSVTIKDSVVDMVNFIRDNSGTSMTVSGNSHFRINGTIPATVTFDEGYYNIGEGFTTDKPDMSSEDIYSFEYVSKVHLVDTATPVDADNHKRTCQCDSNSDMQATITEAHTGMEDDVCDDCNYTQYNIWVGGTRITSLNKGNVLGDGKVTYTPAPDSVSYGTLTVTGEVMVSGSYNDGTSTYGIYATEQLLVTGDMTTSLTVGGENIKYGVYCADDAGLSIEGGMTLNATGSEAGIQASYVYAGTNDDKPAPNDTSAINATGGSYGIRASYVDLYDTNLVTAKATGTSGVGIVAIDENSDLTFNMGPGGHLIANGTGGALSKGGSSNLDLNMDGNRTAFWRFANTGTFESGSKLDDLEFELSNYTIPDYLEIIASDDITHANGKLTCGHGESINAAAMLEYTENTAAYTLYFTDLQPALDTVYDFGTAQTNIKLTLLGDATVTDAPLTVNKTLTLDLAGHQISGSINGALLDVATGGNLTITDSSTGKTGSISNTGTNGIGVQVSAGSLTIGGGTITGVAYGVYVPNGTATVTISGGSITGTRENNGAGIGGEGTITVNGGTITGAAYAVMPMGGTTTVNDGTLIGKYALYIAGTVALNGGDLQGDAADILLSDTPLCVGNLGSANYTLTIFNGSSETSYLIATASEDTPPDPGWFTYVTAAGQADSIHVIIEGSRGADGTSLIEGGEANELYLYKSNVALQSITVKHGTNEVTGGKVSYYPNYSLTVTQVLAKGGNILKKDTDYAVAWFKAENGQPTGSALTKAPTNAPM